jgi:SAM-dependent methyltransferase
MNSIAEFESLVLAQKPAEKPWEPVLAYDIETRRAVEGRQPWLIRDVFKPVDVLDYGCGAGYLVAFLSELGVKVDGYEPSKDLVALAPHYVKHIVRNDVWHHKMNSYSEKGYWDLVICREVLEHLTVLEIRKTVQTLCRYAKRYVYVTTRFHLSPRSVFDVATSDDLDPTHISMCHKDFLRMLFVLEGFKCRPDLESKMDWQKKGRVLVYERAS